MVARMLLEPEFVRGMTSRPITKHGEQRHAIAQAKVDKLEVAVYRVPTDFPESDGTLEWDSTTLVLVQSHAAGKRGLGFTYADLAVASLIHEKLQPDVLGRDALDVPAIWESMVQSIRNLGRPGIASMAIAAIDLSLWDLKANLLDMPLVRLLGAMRPEVPVYGSGGFTSYPIARLQAQLAHWVSLGLTRVKMKVGRSPEADVARVAAARQAIKEKTSLFVDANGAYSRKQALLFSRKFAELGVCWFEEPVVADDLEGLNLIRDRAPAGMDIAAGEYGYDLPYFQRMLQSGAVDVLQADITRCAGLTEFLRVASLCQAYLIPFSAHTAPSLHLHPCCAISPAIHIEYFHDHARIEQMFFDGAAIPAEGVLRPDLSRPGFGLEFKEADARKYAIT